MAVTSRSRTSLLTAALAIVLALGGPWWWALINEIASPISQSCHHDFFAFYSAATLIREGHAQDLYNASVLTALERSIWPQPTGYAGYMPFLNPPSAAVILSPLASLSFATAREVWLCISVVIAVACGLLLTSGRALRVRAIAVAVVLAAFPTYQALVEGQWSFVLLLGSLGALIASRRGHEWLAGVALVALWLKPPLLLLVLVWLVLTRRWRIAGGAVAAVAVLTLVTLPWTGIGADVAYAQYLGGVSVAHAAGGGAAGSTAWEGAFPNMEGVIGLAATLVGQTHAVAVDVLTAVIAAALVVYFVWATRHVWLSRPLPLRVALAALCLGLLLDPHLYAQDCVLLLVLCAVALPRVRAAATASAVLLGIAVVMDFSAIDTYSIQGYPVPPLHLLTFALIGGVIALTWPLRASAAPRPAESR